MSASAIDIDHLRQWIGRSQGTQDLVTARLVDGLWATLDEDPSARRSDVPLGLQWCLAPSTEPMHALAEDGLPARGGFLPPVPLPRRMWAGGRVEINQPFQLGDAVEKTAEIRDVTLKEGRSGTLCFVAVEYRFATPRGLALTERHDIVYRNHDKPGAAAPQATPKVRTPQWRKAVTASPVLLFRYSALTFNGHRIHFDRPYTVEDEGYDGLLVHGPLQATLLLNYAASLKDGRAPKSFDYRAVAPLYDGGEFTLNAAEEEDGLDLWVADGRGAATLTAKAVW